MTAGDQGIELGDTLAEEGQGAAGDLGGRDTCISDVEEAALRCLSHAILPRIQDPSSGDRVRVPERMAPESRAGGVAQPGRAGETCLRTRGGRTASGSERARRGDVLVGAGRAVWGNSATIPTSPVRWPKQCLKDHRFMYQLQVSTT